MTPSSTVRTVLLAVAGAALAGCAVIDDPIRRVANAATPYRVEVVQGNFVSREQVEQLQPGMSRQQVRELLGTPPVTSVFHNDRWDYVFTLRRQGVQPLARRLTLFFKGDLLDKFEGDPMPSETEFVAAIHKQRPGKVPPLEATEEQLQKVAPPKPAAAAPAVPAPAAASYPPLEPPAR